ncbi:hypothetical protein Tamer19_16560 [Cupriavidus sp. TA19]|uniref:hypothetical protein n=1 Tax=unclassified Cupriavidus TaxID=2640874 RepID=UPI002729454F|nr:hypothetical protein [Cupriavidus sp. TA19]GLC92248.1 hypothetical protein Tamer19_16560 [Cupriavidus sp. TA19]
MDTDEFDDLPRDGNVEREVKFLLARVSWESRGRYWQAMAPLIRIGIRRGRTCGRCLRALERLQAAADLPEPREDLRRWFLLNC